jgi:hypothetical protein
MGGAILHNIIEVLQFCNQEKCLFFLVTSRTRVSLHLGLRVGYNELQIKIRNKFGQETTGGRNNRLVCTGLKIQSKQTVSGNISRHIPAETFALIDRTLMLKLKQTKRILHSVVAFP